MAGRQTTENVILNHIVRLIFKEQIALILIDVHTERADFLLFQRVNRRLRIDQAAAAGIDDHHAIFHLTEGGGVQQMMVFRRQRTVQRNHVRLFKQRFDIDILRAQVQRLRVWIRIERQQTHAEPFQDAQRGDADLPGADNASGAAMHVKADQPFQRKVGVAGALISAMNTAVQRHHDTDRVFRYRLRRVGRHAHHLHSQLFRRVQIDVIKTGAA